MKDLLLILFFAGVAWLVWRGFFEKTTPPTLGNPVPPTSNTITPPTPLSPQEKQARHLRNALAFAQAHHKVLSEKQREQAAWQQQFGAAQAAELDELNGVEFEYFLEGLFRSQGYTVELTPSTGDYGADLILSKDGQRIAVQAKRYRGSVGVAAVQEALSGLAYYQCHTAWVVTTGTFTQNALELAQKSGVKMIARSDLGNLMSQVRSAT